MTIGGTSYVASGFPSVAANAGTGNDTATLNGDTGADAFVAGGTERGTLTYAGGPNYVKAAGFDTVTANGGTADTATFNGTEADETFTGGAASSSMSIGGTSYVASGFPWSQPMRGPATTRPRSTATRGSTPSWPAALMAR